jgi:hypothetical protein
MHPDIIKFYKLSGKTILLYRDFSKYNKKYYYETESNRGIDTILVAYLIDNGQMFYTLNSKLFDNLDNVKSYTEVEMLKIIKYKSFI